jgi:hypothetical protein
LARRQRSAREDRLRGLALSIIAGDEELGDDHGLSRADADALVAVLARYARQLTGADRERITAVFERRGDVERAIERLASRRSSRRLRAASTLGDMGSLRAVEPLIEVLTGDHDGDARAAAARSLGRLGDERAVTGLIEALAHTNVPRATAANALRAIGAAAVTELHPLVLRPDPAIRAAAIELIGLLGAAGDVEALKPLLADPAPAVRASAAAALGHLGAGRAAAALQGALDDPVPKVRVAVGRALGAVSGVGDSDVLSASLAPPISIVVKASGGEAAAAESVRALRQLRYHRFEVIVSDGDANVGIEDARYDYICAVEPCTRLADDALSRLAEPIADDPDLVVATAGIGRAAGPLPVVSRVVGLYRRDILETVGGWWPGAAGDLELIVRLHHILHHLGIEYRIEPVPGAVCRDAPPPGPAGLARQSWRWQRSRLLTLWRHRRMIGNPRFGAVGLLAMPALALFGSRAFLRLAALPNRD